MQNGKKAQIYSKAKICWLCSQNAVGSNTALKDGTDTFISKWEDCYNPSSAQSILLNIP